MNAAPPIYSDSALYSTDPPNNRVLSGAPGMLEIQGRLKVPTGQIDPGGTLGLDVNGNLVQGGEIPGGILTGSIEVGGVLATANAFVTTVDGWAVNDTGTLSKGAYGGSGGTFTVTGVSAGLVSVNTISAASAPGFDIATTYAVPGGATVTLTMSAPTTITAVTVVTPGGGYPVGSTLTITDPISLADFTCVVASATSDVTAATVAGGTNYSVGDVLEMNASDENLSATLTVATLVPDNTGLGYTTGIYDLKDTGTGGTGSGATLNVTLVDPAGSIRGSAIVLDGENYTASTLVDVGTLVAPVTKIAKFDIGTTSGGGGGGGVGVDPVERLAANPNTVAATNPVAAACDFTGECNFIAANTTGPTGPFVKAGRRLDLYDPATTTAQAVIQYSATTRGQGTGNPGLREGLSFYSGATAGRNIAMHLTNETQNKPVCVLSRDNDKTEMVVKSFATNDVSMLTVKATNDFTAAVDHCVINLTSQIDDAGTRANTCSLKYVPDQLDTTAGTLTIDRGMQVSGPLGLGNPTDTYPFEVAQVQSTTIWQNLTLETGFGDHPTDKPQYQITTYVRLGVGSAVNTTFQRVDFRGIVKKTVSDLGGNDANMFLFSAQTPALPDPVRRHVVKIMYFVPSSLDINNSSKAINMPASMFYRNTNGVFAGQVLGKGAVIGVDASITTGNNQILDQGYGRVTSEFVLDNTFYYSN